MLLILFMLKLKKLIKEREGSHNDNCDILD